MNKVVFGSMPTQVACEYQFLGKDILIIITGGTHPHVGALAIGEPRHSMSQEDKMSATVSVLTRTGHKDDEIARSVAHEIASYFNQYTIVIAGLHIDQASSSEIDALLHNTQVLVRWLVSNLNPSEESM